MATITYSGGRIFSTNPFDISGTTYIIEGTVLINGGSTYNIAKNVTIIFRGGLITGNGKIIGNNTCLIAPITQIFGNGITIEGNWAIDRSYPQWFSNERYDYDFTEETREDEVEIATSIDWAPSINKAINMKKTGEVFLPRGQYFIKSPIKLRFAINLIGERGRYFNEGAAKAANQSIETISDNNTNGTIVVATCSDSFGGDCLIQVNKSDVADTWQVKYPAAVTRITNLCLWNSLTKHKNGLFGIISYGSCIVDSCQFDNLCCGIKFVTLYSDRREVINSSFTFNRIHQSEIGERTYAIDCDSLGDGQLFRNNHVLYSEHVGALRLTSCGGGVISANVFNSEVYIGSCKGVVYEANHMEDGAQLKIRKSNVLVRSNFIEKGENPSIVVYSEQGHNCIVNLENNQFLCYEYVNRSESETAEAGEDRISKQCAYDIAVDANSSISIKNNFRFPLIKNLGFYGMFAMGIQIAKYPEENGDWIPLTDFNNISYKLSKESFIDNYRVRYPNLLSVGTITKPSIHAHGPNTNVQWLTESGYYEYIINYQNDSGTAISERSDVIQLTKNEGNPAIQDGENRCGYLFDVGNTVRETTVTIMRRMFLHPSQERPQKTHSVILHISGANVLYDNGITINGYKWKEVHNYYG